MLPTCKYWSESSQEWRLDGIALGSVSPEMDGTSTIVCWTFHLSPFGVAQEESGRIEWSSTVQSPSVDIVGEVRRFCLSHVFAFSHSPFKCTTPCVLNRVSCYKLEALDIGVVETSVFLRYMRVGQDLPIV